MNDKIKIALIAAVAVVGSIGVYRYFSPYHSCVRAVQSGGVESQYAHARCAYLFGKAAQ